MKARKILSILLSFVLILGCFPVAMAAAADVPTLEVVTETTGVGKGDVISYEVWLCNASLFTDGVWNVTFTLDIPEGLELVEYEVPDSFNETTNFEGTKFTKSTRIFASNGTDGGDDNLGYTGADVLCMTFDCKVLDTAANGAAVVTLTGTDLSDGFNSFEANVIGASVMICDHSDFETIPAVPATCTSTGLTEGQKCKTCGKVLKAQEETAKLDHTYGEPVVTTEPTCTETGEQVLTCTACGATKTETVDANGHTFDIEHAQIDPTCVATGIVARHECSVCGVYDIADDAAVIGMVKHVYEVKDENEEYITYACKVCGHEYQEEVLSNVESEVDENGNVIITTTNEDGTVTTEVRADGVTVTTTTDEAGNVLSTEVKIDAASGVVELPIDAIVADSETTITIDTNSNDDVAVEVPVENVTAGTVVVIVNEDGTEEVIATTKMTENGLVFACPDGATIKVVDNAKDFADVAGNNWYNDAVDFVSARGIMSGMEDGIFAAETATTRAQFWTMLARLAGVDTTAAEGEAWYAVAQAWAIENGISDGTDANGEITREQLVTMLYRFVGGEGESKSIEGFSDAADVSDWALAAMEWAYGEGVMNGNTDGTMNPAGQTIRSEIAQFFMNFIQSL